MTPQDKKISFWLAILGGSTRLVSQLLYTLLGVEGFWFVGNCLSHVFFWMSLNKLLQTNKTAKLTTTAFLLLSVNDLLDQVLFDPGSFGWNEKVFFTLVIMWYTANILKWRKAKNG